MSNEKKRILKLVESGKITVEEGLSLLEKLEEQKYTGLDKEESVILDEPYKESKFKEKKKETYSSPSFNFQLAKDKIFDFVDTTIKKVKEVDLDLNFGRFEEVTHVFQFTDTQPKNIDIDIPNGEVEIIPWDQQDIRIECKAKIYRVESSEQAKQTFLKEVKVKANEEVLELKVYHKWMKLQTQVYLPKASYDITKVRLFNGPIKTVDLQANRLFVKTANGKINLFEGSFQKVEADAANGSILIENGLIDELDAETINGAITVNGHFKKVDLQSFNGNIVCINQSKECEYLELKGTTGSVEVHVPEELAINGVLKTNFGGFNVELEGIQIIEEKNEVLQKTLKFQSIQSSEKRMEIDANTKTGSIKIKKILEKVNER